MTYTDLIGEVATMKFNSGEELLAKILEANGDHLVVNDPVSVAPGPQGLGLVPSLFTAEQGANVRLNINSIAMVTLTEDSVKMKYIEAVYGIQVPSKKIIMG